MVLFNLNCSLQVRVQASHKSVFVHGPSCLKGLPVRPFPSWRGGRRSGRPSHAAAPGSASGPEPLVGRGGVPPASLPAQGPPLWMCGDLKAALSWGHRPDSPSCTPTRTGGPQHRPGSSGLSEGRAGGPWVLLASWLPRPSLQPLLSSVLCSRWGGSRLHFRPGCSKPPGSELGWAEPHAL